MPGADYQDNMKPIVMDMFDKHEALLSRLTERPFVRAYILGLRLRWEQFKEPPPQPPPQVVAEASKRSAADEEEAWFNQSDDEEGDADGESTVPSLPVKRKRAQQQSGGPSPKRLSAGSGSSALGLDYDDASDSDGSTGAESPKVRPLVPAPEPDSDLVEGLSDVERKIRAKRIRNEEEEEGSAFTELMSGPRKDASGAAFPVKVVHEEDAATEGGGAGRDKKIRLSLGNLGRKLRGGEV